MAFDNAKRILQDSEARVASSAEGIYDDDLVVLFWQNIEAHYIDECIRYLNDSSVRALTGPTTFYDTTFNDDLYHLHAYYNESDQRIYRVLMKSAATTSSITQSGTKWRLQSGETYQAGTSNLVLVMYNVDPDYIVALETESLSTTYEGTIYLLGGTQLTGTWHSIARESDFNSDTGLYDLRWYVSRYEAKEYMFVSKRNSFQEEVQFYRYRMTETSIDDFENNYYFDTSTLGDYYYSADGSNYTKKNNASATGTLPSTAKNILTSIAGRSLNYEQRPDRDTGEIDIVVTFIHDTASTAEGGSTSSANSTVVTITNNATQELGDPTPSFKLTMTGTHSAATGTYQLNPNLSRYERLSDNLNYDEQWTIFRDSQQTGTDTYAHSWLLYDEVNNNQVYFSSNYSSLAAFKTAENNPTDGTITNGTFSEKSEGLHHVQDNSTIQHESQQLENGLFRNVQTISTNFNQTASSESKLHAYTDTVEFNSASTTSVTPGSPSAGTQVTVENTPNEDGTFNTVKRTRVFNLQTATSGSCNDAYTETVIIEENASSALGTPADQSNGVTVIHESQELENGKFRNITRTRTAKSRDNVTDENTTGADGQAGFTETIVKKYNQTNPENTTGDTAAGTTITVENILRDDGKYDTIKSTRVDRNRTATSGSTNAFSGETVVIATNASSALSAPSDQSDGTIVIHESEQLENGLFRNITRTRTARTDIATVTDNTELSDAGAGGYTQSVVKKFNQSSAETISESDTEAGTIVEVQNNINEDGTYNTIKSIRTERSLTAEGGSTTALNKEEIIITVNAAAELGEPSDQADGIILSHQSEQLPNGLFRNTQRKVTARTDVATVTDSTEISDAGAGGYLETITKKINQSSQATIDESDTAAGSIVTVENTINEDGTFNTLKRVRTERSLTSSAKSESVNTSTTVEIVNNASAALGTSQSTPSAGTTITRESTPLDNGLFRNVTTTVIDNSRSDTEDTLSQLVSEDINITYHTTISGQSALSAEQGKIKTRINEELDNGKYKVTEKTITSSAFPSSGAIDDQVIVGAGGSTDAGYTEDITKKFNQTSEETIDSSDIAEGKIVSVQNNVNEDGTFNTVKTIRSQRKQSATSGTKNHLRTEAVVIEENADAALGTPSSQTDGTIVINESEQLENGKFRNVSRTITSRDDCDTVTNEVASGDDAGGGYTETTIIQYNKASPISIGSSEDTAGKTISVTNELQEDGLYTTTKVERIDRSRSAVSGVASDEYIETVTTEYNASSALGAPSYTAGQIKTFSSEQNANGKFTNVSSQRVLSSQDFGVTNQSNTTLNNPDMDFVQRYGEPHKLTTLMGVYKGNTLPSKQDISGSFKAGGREKVIKRIANPTIISGKYSYYLYEDHYIAPQNDSDDWFIHASTLTWQKNRETIGNFISDNAGNTGWMPIDVGSVGGPKFAKIEQATRRTKTTIVYRKYFVRRPTAADLNTASINTSSNEMTNPMSATTISTAYKTVQVSQHLFAVEKIVTSLGTRVADSDGLIGTTGADYTGLAGSALT